MKKILVIFKTLLDVGFTDFTSEVVKKYNEDYIPRAIRVARELAARGCKEGFTWTTGSWLIYQYLEQADEVHTLEMEEAIRNKWIRWHAIPTTSTEGMNADLFKYGLSLSCELDGRYGVEIIKDRYASRGLFAHLSAHRPTVGGQEYGVRSLPHRGRWMPVGQTEGVFVSGNRSCTGTPSVIALQCQLPPGGSLPPPYGDRGI